MARYRNLMVGDPAPWFRQASLSNPSYAFDAVAGRFVVLAFFGSANSAPGTHARAFVQANRAMFDDSRLAFFGVSSDPEDAAAGRLQE